MKIIAINELNNTRLYQPPKAKKLEINVDNRGLAYNNINFYGVTNAGAVTTKIKSNKAKLLNIFKEILSSQKTFRTKAELEAHKINRALSIINYKLKKHQELSCMAEYFISLMPRGLTNHEKKCLEGIALELKRIEKIPLYEEPKKSKYDAEDYDVALINLFQKAIQNDDFDLLTVYKNYYKKLEQVETLEELHMRFPAIKLPKSPIDSVAKKVLALIPQEIHEKHRQSLIFGDELFAIKSDIGTEISEFILITLKNMGVNMGTYNVVRIGKKVIDGFKRIYSKGSEKHLPKMYLGKPNKNNENLTNLEKELLDIDYEKFVLTVIREHYINEKKLNEITYQENGKTLKVSDFRDSEYRFEKRSEKIKKFITEAEKIKLIQRDYANYTQEELKSRLEYYANSNLGSNEELFNLICDFHACKFIAEDRGYLIKLLSILDKVYDKAMSLEEGLNYLKENKIRPLGTHNIKSLEKQKIKEKLLEERLFNQTIQKAQDDFYETINYLYSNNMTQLVDICTKYNPDKADYSGIIAALISIGLIKEIIKNNTPEEAQNKILRLEAYKDSIEQDNMSVSSNEALAYADKYENNVSEVNLTEPVKSYIESILPDKLNIQNYSELFSILDNLARKEKIGQYILNRRVVESYPDSKNLVPYTQILDKIMQNFGDDKNLATELLCKYHDYYSLDEKEKTYIANILKIFDYKNVDDRIVLKEIIENDYINSDTSILVNEENVPKPRTIASTAKQELYDKYRFPNSVPFFEKFEAALPLNARSKHSPGVKKIARNNKQALYKSEVKIMGHDDRLVADNDDYYFNHYSEGGIHD